MTAVLLTLALLASFWLVGLATLCVLRVDVGSVRESLTAPAVGVAVITLATFLLSYAGLTVASFAAPFAIVILLAAGVVICVRRPRVAPVSGLVAAISVVALAIGAWPMFSLGFRWIGNANADMGYYSLRAQQLLHHGLIARTNTAALLAGHDYATNWAMGLQQGTRPGGDLVLSLVSALSGRFPYEIYMPLIFAVAMAGIAAVGALAAQRQLPWWTAPLAAGLLAVSPLFTYGVLQQLIAQIFGMTIAVALVALLLRPGLHRDRVRVLSDIVPIGLLLAGLILTYTELSPIIALGYLVYVVALIVRRELVPSVALRLWIGVALVALVLLNAYLPSEISYVTGTVGGGSSTYGHPPLFGYFLLPSALPTLLGLQQLNTQTDAPLLGFSIALALVVVVAAALAAIRETLRGSAVAAMLIGCAILAAYLVSRTADFGLLKLSMYVQPFLAAGLALVVGRLRLRFLLPAVAALVLLAVADISTQQIYVSGSQNPGDFRDASAADLLPVAAAAIDRSHRTTIAVGDNAVFVYLTAVDAYGHTVFFLSRAMFPVAPAKVKSSIRHYGPRGANVSATNARFSLHTTNHTSDGFTISPRAEASLASGDCTLLIPTGRDVPFNRLSLPEDGPDLKVSSCAATRDLLAPVVSTLGQPFYLGDVNHTSVYQLQPDPFYPGRTFAGLGRDQLFEVLGATPRMRVELSYTFSFRHDGNNTIPHSAIVGNTRVPLPVVGNGSARVISPPVQPQMIDGHPYLLLDVGEKARISYDRRRGLDALFGTSIPLDQRRLTGYLRDVSLVSASQYAKLRPPLSVSSLPSGLANPALQYSGVYEDGWVGEDSSFVLGGGGPATFELRASTPPGAARHLVVTVNGRQIAAIAVQPGPISLSVPVGASAGPRHVVLRFAGFVRLPAPDYRPASALLGSIGFDPAATSTGH